MACTINTLYIVNKSGSLVYHRDVSPTTKFADTNDYLQVASTFHSLLLFSKQLAPVPSGGIQRVEAPTFNLECFTSPTGMEFIATTSKPRGGPEIPGAQAFLRKIYEFYTDFVLKNPFYDIDQPMYRIRLFDSSIDKWARENGFSASAASSNSAAAR